MRDIPFIDTYVHLWDPSHMRYPWLSPPLRDDKPNGSVEPIADARGMVHVDAGAEGRALKGWKGASRHMRS
jgi:predicted TIM-barrel fold metal-dependent hydrolase